MLKKSVEYQIFGFIWVMFKAHEYPITSQRKPFERREVLCVPNVLSGFYVMFCRHFKASGDRTNVQKYIT